MCLKFLVLSLFLVNGVYSLTGGINAIVGQFPSHVSIQAADRSCGGTIVNPNHILTAASCILNQQHHLIAANTVFIRAGLTILNNDLPRTNVIAIFPHPHFDPYTFENDVAVLRIAGNFTFNVNIPNPNVAAITINPRLVADATPCQVVGFNVPTAAIPAQPLQVLDVNVRNRDTECPVPTTRVLESKLCAANPVVAVSGVVASTRGGGLYCNNQLVGLVSSCFNCPIVNNGPIILTQLRRYNVWIQQQFTRVQIPAAGPTPMPGYNSSSGLVGSITMIVIAFAGFYVL